MSFSIPLAFSEKQRANLFLFRVGEQADRDAYRANPELQSETLRSLAGNERTKGRTDRRKTGRVRGVS